jgi:hypothetical protein
VVRNCHVYQYAHIKCDYCGDKKLQSTGTLRGIRKKNLHSGMLCMPTNRAYWYAEEVHIDVTTMAYWYALSTY